MLRRVKNYGHLLFAFSANTRYGFPSKRVKIIGITGTDGKTTTASLIFHILKSSGRKAALISTVGVVINETKHDLAFHVTTPSPFLVQKYISLAASQGCEFVVLETTSHALNQHRVWGIEFEIGVLTNITHEHLDYHKNYVNYVKEKLKLLKRSKVAVVNSNGPWFEYVKKEIPKGKLKTFSLHNQNDDLTIEKLNFNFTTTLIGDFNKENILAAVLATRIAGVSDGKIKSGIQSFVAPEGRQKVIEKNEITVMIDFAHTPNALDKILSETRKLTKGRLIHVFGSAGRRDKEKRKTMGEMSAKYSDVIILTAEDPRGESVEEINHQILKGIDGFVLYKEEEQDKRSVISIPDREDAINYAFEISKRGDFILITGKGHEKSMNYTGEEIPWSDEGIVIKALNEI